MHNRLLCVIASLLLLLPLTSCGTAEEATAWTAPLSVRDVEYVVRGEISLRLDAHVPAGPGPFPAFVWLHGGGWESGDKASFNYAVNTYRRAGIASFSVNYRLSGQETYPAALEDCLAAVGWVRQHAAEYRIDPDRIAVGGGSAGGHLAMMVATAKPLEGDVNSRGEPLKCLVKAAVSMAGPMDLTMFTYLPEATPEAPGALYALRVLTKFLGGTPREVPERYIEASPITRVTTDTAPTLLVYGLEDRLIRPRQATRMAERLREAGVEVKELPLEGRGHEVAAMAALPEVVEWVAGQLERPALPED
jgi:acetyl esterase/lipase